MLKGQNFYHGTIRKMIAIFGDLFNDIDIVQRDSTGKPIKRIKVPIQYASKEHYMSIALRNPVDEKVSFTLPAMAFQISSITYDATRKLSTINRQVAVDETDSSIVSYAYVSVPYNISISLNVFARNTEDGLQIVEQILPWFTPSFTVRAKLIPELNLIKNIPITLTGVTPSEEFEIDETPKTKKFLWTLDFSMKTEVFGPISTGGLITKVITQTYPQAQDFTLEDPTSNTLTLADSRTTITPDPPTANSQSDYGYTVTTLYHNE